MKVILGQFPVYPVHQLRFVVKGIQVIFNAEQRSGEPEKTFQRQPLGIVAPFMAFLPFPGAG